MKELQNSKCETALLILLFVTTGFIWINSMLPGATSSDESGFVMRIITPFMEIFVGKGNVTMFLVRKLAHFTEYFVLGSELTIYASICNWIQESKKEWLQFIFPLGCGLLIASLDETIQIFADSRGPSVKDVLLDFAGVCTAVLILRILIKISTTRRTE